MRVLGIGRLTSKPELKELNGGKKVTNFTLDSQKRFKNSDHPESNFIDCVAWEKTAETICNYLDKGQRMFIEGELETESYEDSDNKKRKKTKVIVDKFEFVERKLDNVSSENSEKNNTEEDSEDQLPF